jgi:putative salt-induced outer membrane protein YdiY
MIKKIYNLLAMIVCGVALTAGGSAFAADVEMEEGVWAFAIDFGLNLADGNSDTVALTLGAEAAKNWAQNEFFSRADYRYGETNSKISTENIEAVAQYNRLFSDVDYGYLTSTFRWDDIAKMDSRWYIGPGYGRYLVQNDTTEVAGEIGVSFFTEDVANRTDDGVALRIGQRWTQVLSETAHLSQYLEYLPQLDDFGDYLLNAGIAVEAAINSMVNLRIAIDDRFDKTPGVGLKDNDLFITAGLVYRP